MEAVFGHGRGEIVPDCLWSSEPFPLLLSTLLVLRSWKSGSTLPESLVSCIPVSNTLI